MRSRLQQMMLQAGGAVRAVDRGVVRVRQGRGPRLGRQCPVLPTAAEEALGADGTKVTGALFALSAAVAVTGQLRLTGWTERVCAPGLTGWAKRFRAPHQALAGGRPRWATRSSLSLSCPPSRPPGRRRRPPCRCPSLAGRPATVRAAARPAPPARPVPPLPP